ncbi:MAG: hypothetical protein QOE92_2044, partial [Chloroflexota bacterium]|nr:hypothetical protein [Chloroflexota bacterium]
MPRRRGRPWQSDAPRRPSRTPGAGRVRRVDLHGYDVLTAVAVVETTLREAYENGYQAVEAIHGAADVVQAVQPGEGRGGIKWELRRMADRGAFNGLCATIDQMPGSITFTIRANPRQRSERWT